MKFLSEESCRPIFCKLTNCVFHDIFSNNFEQFLFRTPMGTALVRGKLTRGNGDNSEDN